MLKIHRIFFPNARPSCHLHDQRWIVVSLLFSRTIMVYGLDIYGGEWRDVIIIVCNCKHMSTDVLKLVVSRLNP